ncbi:methylcytosine dioxygenase TET isoform X2 [Tribolium castaneum]|uniref:methylcytosine dioxygenase TET isoform X2 n=1 Tax=Tribolium castaneum TaxID=7070 RepID=UPI00077DC0B5|nr:PREDICTED: DNA N6-methyl adenine demethylase isoform X2 [Tribolium castaneum]|eukprot:XP_015835502.1 PREDICTED: DNA N6-methyl adenine demethylase isoform X2 [Tribolium castaneum]
MSETLSQDPELNTGYTNLAPSYPPTPATPSSTVQDGPPGANLPPFSTFSSDMDSNAVFNTATDRLFSDTRLLDISNWDYYTAEGRLLERGENGLSIISSQPQYRPWESKSVDSSTGFTSTTPVNTFADAFNQNGVVSKLPSFQSQFQTFNEPVTTSEPTLTTLTNLTPVSPNSSSPGSHSLTPLNSNFHTLSAVNRGYPLVPAPIQAREIPSIQQQFLDERHIQLYAHPPNLNSTIHFPAQNGTIIQNSPLISSPTVVTVLKSEPDLKLTTLQDTGLKIQNLPQFQNPMVSDNGIYNGLDKKLNGISATMSSPTRNDFRKKERRKMRASSLESSAESDGASSNLEMAENSGQVAAVSSTAGFKTHHSLAGNNAVDIDEISGGNVDKQVKKKRKRCGECIGCQRKDNCGDCAPCRNDKSHQICKQRRCEKLTEKKSYRGRKPSGPIASVPSGAPSGVPQESNGNVTIISNQQQPARPSPQPPTATVQQAIPVQQQSTMTPMPFYADPNRFPTPVWQADPTQAWTQGQFIQQIPAGTQALETYQQYPNGIYQATYQQPTFETNTFYTGAVQVLTRPPSAPNQTQVTPRPNSNYSHTPSPAPSNRQYQEYNPQNQNFVSPATTPSGNPESVSRPSSVNSTASNQNFNQSGANFTSVSSPSNYGNSGNAQPGYPQVNSSPQLASHSSSGYPGSGQFSGTSQEMWQEESVWQEEAKPEQNDRVNLNTRIKTMILSKQQENSEEKKVENTTGHFLWYSHHHRFIVNGGGGAKLTTTKPKQLPKKRYSSPYENEIPYCNCVRAGRGAAEPGTFYTHLGCANNLINLRHDLETRTGVKGRAIRIEKIRYTGKEGKTAQGCPIAKWVIRRSGSDEKYLIIVKHRPGHSCPSAFIVVCIVMWDGLPQPTSDELYTLLTSKLNKFGLANRRRCATNESKTCACQGLNPDTCGASFSFGCSWSMYYNGCKFSRSKFVRKFRLNVQPEEKIVEEKLQILATYLSPIYRSLAPVAFRNQCFFEEGGRECRLGLRPGRPFSGVTACLDFCAHSHKDSHNMVNGCTVVVTLTKHRKGEKPEDEQLHVLPLYVVEGTDEFDSQGGQEEKIRMGSIEVLTKFETEIRSSRAPAQKPEKRTKASKSSVFATPPTEPSYGYTNSYYVKLNQAAKKLFASYPSDHSIPPADGCYSSGFTNLPYYNPIDNYFSTVGNLLSSKLNQVQKTSSDNSDCFTDSSVGGVAIALEHGSVLLECARHEVHATTALKAPNRRSPTRISLVFYQHRNLNKSRHGWDEFAKRKLQKGLTTLFPKVRDIGMRF